MVWKCIQSCQVSSTPLYSESTLTLRQRRSPTSLWQAVYLLQVKGPLCFPLQHVSSTNRDGIVDVSLVSLPVRGRITYLWSRNFVDYVDYRPSRCWTWKLWHSEWCIHDDRCNCSAGEAACPDGYPYRWCPARPRRGTPHWWCADGASNMAMV